MSRNARTKQTASLVPAFRLEGAMILMVLASALWVLVEAVPPPAA